MFFESLEDLTPAQRKELAEHGIASTRISEWKKKKVFPGRTHTAIYCTVTGLDLATVNEELTQEEMARDAQRNGNFRSIAAQIKDRSMLIQRALA